MIIGAHAILYSRNAEADRAFFRDALGFPHVDVGDGWLIFGLPPSEVAFHPGDDGTEQEFHLMCEDVEAFAKAMAKRGASCGPRQSMGWGVLTELTLPSGAKVGVYQPRHARPKAAKAGARKAARKAPAKKAAKPKRAVKSAKRKPKTKAKPRRK